MNQHQPAAAEPARRRGPSDHARHVGRVGVLAVALGVGLGVGSLFDSTPVASADTTGSAESSTGPAGPAARGSSRGGPAVAGRSAAARSAATGSHSGPARVRGGGLADTEPTPALSPALPSPTAAVRPAATGAANGMVTVPVAQPTAGSTGGGPASGTVTSAAAATGQGRRAVARPATAAASTTTGEPGPAAPPLASATPAQSAAKAAASTLPVGPVQAAILAAKAYIYGYPILATQRVQALLGPLNTLNLNTSFANPSSAPFWQAIGGGSHPNVNVLYSLASLDLSNGPVVLSVPNMGNRYYSFQLTDPYINVDNYISSNPTQSNPIGGQGPGAFAITWVGKDVDVAGAQKVLVDYSSELLLGRVEATPLNAPGAAALMKQWTLTPTGATSANNAVIPSSYLSPISVLNAISTAITQNPPYPPEQDAKELAQLARIGVGPDPTNPEKAMQVADHLGPLSQWAASLAVQMTADFLPKLTDITQTLSALRNHGWAVTQPNIGDFGTDYVYRAGVAYVGLVANTPDQALYFPGTLDSKLRQLNGKKSYLLHFAPGQTPPIVDGGFWSLTAYNKDGKLVTVKNVYSNSGSLKTRADGSIDVILSQMEPTDTGANWLQVPDGPFSTYLRLYGPGSTAAGGSWLPPAIERTSGG